MCLAYQTVKGYRSNLVFKLDAHNTAGLVKMAIEQKLVQGEQKAYPIFFVTSIFPLYV